jgi:hypothetical protein
MLLHLELLLIGGLKAKLAAAAAAAACQHCHQYRFLQLTYNHKPCCKPVVSRL